MKPKLYMFSIIFAVLTLCVQALASPSPSTVTAQDQGYLHFIDSDDKEGIKKYNDCGQFWPSRGMFQTSSDGYEYSAVLHFQLSQEEKKALLCVDEYLELDFALRGFSVPTGWKDYSISTNIPGGVPDTPFMDEKDKPSPAVTGIKVSDLASDYEYYAAISFRGLAPNGDGVPRVAFEWQASHWASPYNPLEASCSSVIPSPEWCVFKTVSVYLSNGYTAAEYGTGQGLPFDGYRFWEFRSDGPSPIPTIPAAPPTHYCHLNDLH